MLQVYPQGVMQEIPICGLLHPEELGHYCARRAASAPPANDVAESGIVFHPTLNILCSDYP